MSVLRVLLHRQPPPRLAASWRAARCYATASKPAPQTSPASPPKATPAEAPAAAKPADATKPLKSACLEGTELAGMRWLKDQGPVVALADDEYPDWLWTLLQPKQLPDDGPGGKAEKVRLRKLNRQGIRERNFMSTQ